MHDCRLIEDRRVVSPTRRGDQPEPEGTDRIGPENAHAARREGDRDALRTLATAASTRSRSRLAVTRGRIRQIETRSAAPTSGMKTPRNDDNRRRRKDSGRRSAVRAASSARARVRMRRPHRGKDLRRRMPPCSREEGHRSSWRRIAGGGGGVLPIVLPGPVRCVALRASDSQRCSAPPGGGGDRVSAGAAATIPAHQPPGHDQWGGTVARRAIAARPGRRGGRNNLGGGVVEEQQWLAWMAWARAWIEQSTTKRGTGVENGYYHNKMSG